MNFKKRTQAVFYFNNIMTDLLNNDFNNCKFDALHLCLKNDAINLNIPEFSTFVSAFGNYRNINDNKMWYSKQLESINNLANNEKVCDYFIDLYKQIYFGH